MSPVDEAAMATVRVARALEIAGIEYLVGGSVASSSFGEPRSTRDIDFAVRLKEGDIPGLLEALGSDFAADPEMLREAVRSGKCANIFYLPFFMKVDLFVRGNDAYDRAEFSRSTRIEPVPGETLFASSPEDCLLWKLRWFQMGGGVSDQQWRDVLGLLRISGEKMDLQYVRSWAKSHDVEALLDRALAQAPV
jgi:hypothetical protein